MKKHITLQGAGILTVFICTQSLIGSLVEHVAFVPVEGQFICAAQVGDKEKIIKLHAQSKHLIHYKDGLEEWSALHHATRAQREDVITLLLDLKADVQVKTSFGNTPLHLATQERGNAKIIKLLIEKQADVDCINKRGDTPLRLAARLNNKEVIEVLLSYGACYNLRDTSFLTYVKEACKPTHKRKRSKKSLSETSAFLNPRVRHKTDPREMPLQAPSVMLPRSDSKTTRTIQQREAVAQGSDSFGQHLHRAVAATVLRDVTKPDSVDTRGGWTSLHEAASKGQVVVVIMLLRAGANKEALDAYSFTPLHVASDRGHEVVVDLLLSAGSKIDALALQGFTPLHRAALNGHWAVVVMLLVAGAKINVVDIRRGWTPLHLAASRGHERAVTMLLIAGANKEMVDNDGLTPLALAEKNGHTATVEALKDDHIEASSRR